MAVLDGASHRELRAICEVLIRRDFGTSPLRTHPGLVAIRKSPRRYTPHLTAEIQRVGSHTGKSILGQPQSYRDIVHDVARKLKVRPKPALREPVAKTELRIVQHVLAKAYRKMTEEERQAILLELLGRKDGPEEISRLRKSHGGKLPHVLPFVMYAAGAGAVRITGFAAYTAVSTVLRIVVARLFGRAILPFIAYQGTSRLLSLLTGPIGWMLAGALAVNDLAGKRYTKTIPLVLTVAAIRLRTSH